MLKGAFSGDQKHFFHLKSLNKHRHLLPRLCVGTESRRREEDLLAGGSEGREATRTAEVRQEAEKAAQELHAKIRVGKPNHKH